MTAESRRDQAAVNAIFGAELPKESTDERDVDASRVAEEHDQWLRDNVPPHHD